MGLQMRSMTVTTSGRRARAGLCLGAVALLTGCGADRPAPETVVTVTVTPTITVTRALPTPTSATTSTGSAKSDVVGRRFDLGTIVRVTKEQGVPVIVFDRWTARGVSDSTIAASGVPVRVHSDAPYENLNAAVTYRIPVAPDATFIYAHCVDVDQPAERRSSTLDEFTRLPEAEKVVLLTLDDRGRATRARNDPAC